METCARTWMRRIYNGMPSPPLISFKVRKPFQFVDQKAKQKNIFVITAFALSEMTISKWLWFEGILYIWTDQKLETLEMPSQVLGSVHCTRSTKCSVAEAKINKQFQVFEGEKKQLFHLVLFQLYSVALVKMYPYYRCYATLPLLYFYSSTCQKLKSVCMHCVCLCVCVLRRFDSVCASKSTVAW